MTIQEAVKHIMETPSDWARPKSWGGAGQAIAFREDIKDIVTVPSFHGGGRWYPRIHEILDEWEIVLPGVVNAEYSKITTT